MESKKSLQEQYAFKSICYGCGPSNPKGLKIRSIEAGDHTTCDWKPEPHHHAFPGVVNGGIIGSILDCHCNWTAAWWLMKQNAQSEPPCTVTAEYLVKMNRPTPTDETLHLKAWVVEDQSDKTTGKVTVEATLTAKGKVTATCRGVFVAVKEGHPAFHRW